MFRQVTQTMTTNDVGLYRAVLPKGTTLAMAHDGSGLLGTAVKSGEGIVGQARFIPVDGMTQTVVTTLPIDPMMLAIAIAMADINRKLDAIQKTQQEMFEYIKQRDKAKLEGDLNTLVDILNSYKFNWNNVIYKANKQILAQNIKRSSEAAIKFKRAQINSALQKSTPIHMNKDVRIVTENVRELLRDYQLALYLYAFSSFLEPLLLENFNHEYLSSIAQKNDDYSIQYRELYTQCYNQLEGLANSSIEAFWLDNLSKLGEDAGNMLAKTPIGDKTQIDEALLSAGKDVGDVRKRDTKRNMDVIIEAKDEMVRPFINNIKTMDRMYNDPIELFVAEDGIYMHRLEE